MEPKTFFRTPKFLSVKIFLISLSATLTLWIWGMISTQDLINKAIANINPTPDKTTSEIQVTPTPSLRKVQLPGMPTPVPSTNNYSQPARPKSLPLTNTGSSRP